MDEPHAPAKIRTKEGHPVMAFLLALPLIAGGVGVIGGTAWLFIDDVRFVRAAQATEGIVVGLEESDGVEFPIIDFTHPTAGKVRFRDRLSGGHRGERVKVYFDPENPELARADHQGWPAVFAVIGAILGGLSLYFGVLLLIWSVYWGPRERRAKLAAGYSTARPSRAGSPD